MIEFNFSSFKLAVLLSLIMTLMKIIGWINISIWIILLPIFIVIGVWFFIVFLIGLITIILVANQLNNDTGESEIEA